MPTIPAPKVSGAALTVKAALVAVPDDEAESPNGEFNVILATPDKDREGEEVKASEWKQPLPDHITFDSDHGMDVKSIVGSGTPTLMPDGTVHVKGTYASTEHAQMVRQLVNDPAKHIRTVSVTFLSRKRTVKAAGGRNQVVVERELLNGSFVAVPANPNAVILSSKSATANDGADGGSPAGGPNPDPREMIQAIHNAAVHMGADCVTASQEGDAMAANAEASTGSKSLDAKTTAIAQGLDAAIDEAVKLVAGVDQESLPEPVAQALALLNGAQSQVDDLLDALDVFDADDTDDAAPDAGGAKSLGAALELLVNTGMTRAEAADFLGVNHKGVTLASSGTATAEPAAAAEESAAAADNSAAVAPLTARTDALIKSLDAATTG